MSLRTRLVVELRRSDSGRVLDLPPNRVVEAVCTVLGQPAAGIVMFHRLLRLPVAACGAQVDEAEQLQVTLGEGPCLAAAEAGTPMAFGEAELAERFPLYLDGLRRRTPYRSTVSLPLKRSDGRAFAALDVYCWTPAPELPAPLDVIQEDVAEIVAMLVLGASGPEQGQLAWPASAELRRRREVWIAIGMVLEAAHVDDTDALALLRAHAFRHDTLLDDVAGRMLTGHLTTDEVLAT